MAIDLATCMFLIASSEGVAVTDSEKNPSGFVGISLATKNGFISRALLGGQNLEQREKLKGELDKCSL